jgi:hypothetical protein
MILAAMGDEAGARRMLDRLLGRLDNPYTVAAKVDISSLCFALGEDEKGFDLIEAAELEGSKDLWMLVAWPAFDRVRPHPRFQALLKESGLAD